jgi:hypothetical protein
MTNDTSFVDAAVFESLTPDEQAQAARMLAELDDRGYEAVGAHGLVRPGVRIRHRGHQFPEAYTNGTGTVLVVTERSPSSWSQTHGMPDVELIAVWDRPNLADSRLSQVAQYHVDVIGGAL